MRPPSRSDVEFGQPNQPATSTMMGASPLLPSLFGPTTSPTMPLDNSHPVVIVTRDTAIPGAVVSRLRSDHERLSGHVAEVSVARQEGLDRESAANCDNVCTLPVQVLVRRRGHLDAAKLSDLDAALTIALGLD